MSDQSQAYERCRAFIDSNFITPQPRRMREHAAVTISRQAFSCSHEIAEELIQLVQKDPKFGHGKWAIFDRSLVGKVLDDHDLPKTIAKFMPEDKDHDFTGIINEILGRHPSLWDLFQHTCDTVYKLAKVGNVVVIGRGGNIITRKLKHVLHVRIVAPFEVRVQRAMKLRKIPEDQAVKMIRQEDSARAAFIRSHFDESADNPLGYDIVINTGNIAPKTAAHLLHAALRNR